MPLLSGLNKDHSSTNGFFMTVCLHRLFFTFKMETVYIKTPLGIAAITGDVHGV
jgi:hypothetical protein